MLVDDRRPRPRADLHANGGGNLSGAPSALETVLIGGVGAPIYTPRGAGAGNFAYGLGGGASAPSGGFIPAQSGTDARVNGSPSTTNIGAGSPGYAGSSGSRQTAGHGGAYLILED